MHAYQVAGSAMRMFEALAHAAPTILVGLFVAALFEFPLGRFAVRRLFGHGTWRALPQAWLMGMLLPVCSLGVIPVIRQLRRCGLRGGTVLAFAITAPLFNPLSLLYGLTLSEPWTILAFAFGSLLIVTVVGTALDRWMPALAVSDEPAHELPPGWRRAAGMCLMAAQEMAGAGAGYILAGLLGVGLLATVLPMGSLQMSIEHDNAWAPMIMAGVAPPAYVTPLTVMGQIGTMFQHGNSVGAAFILLTLGAGMNLGLAWWVARNYGLRRCLIWFAVVFAVVIALAYAIEDPLYPSSVDPAGHTHAFDLFCQPFSAGPSIIDQVRMQLGRGLPEHEWIGLALLGAVALAGLLTRLADALGYSLSSWLAHTAPRASSASGRLDFAIPGPVLGGIGIAGLVVFSVIGCYSYYPPAEEVLDQMRVLETELFTASVTGDRERAEVLIPLIEDLGRRLQVGVHLRRGNLSDYERMKARVLAGKLELLEHAIEDHDDVERVRPLALSADRALSRMRRAFLEQ